MFWIILSRRDCIVKSSERTITYSGNYIALTRNELIENVKLQMKESRFKHVLRVEKAALNLAEKNQVKLEKASIAALTHDYAKEFNDEKMIKMIKEENLDSNMIPFGNNIWHGPCGAYIVRKELGVTDEEILNAIRNHTTGAPKMSLLEQIIYVADYIEENRAFPGVEEARKLAENHLSDAVGYEAKHTLSYLIESNKLVFPKAIDTYNAWAAK